MNVNMLYRREQVEEEILYTTETYLQVENNNACTQNIIIQTNQIRQLGIDHHTHGTWSIP